MKNPIMPFFRILIFSGLISVAHAAQNDRGIGIYVDQDLLVPFLNEDRDYTMGLAIEFFWSKDKGLYPLDGMVRKTGKLLGLDITHPDVVYSFMLGSVNYTPDDLSNPNPIYTDRPYSSLIYLSNKRVMADSNNAIAMEVLIGILGTSVAKETQLLLHGWWRSITDSNQPVDPRGWSHQISNGGEPTIRIRLSKSHLQTALSKPGKWDIATSWGLSLGYQTNINAAIAVRAGNINSSFWSLPFDPVNRGNFLPTLPKNEWYFWAAYRAHLIGYDALLQGQFRDSDVTFSHNQIKRVVHDGAAGLTIGNKRSQVTFSVNGKSAELKTSAQRRHFWGNVNFLFHF